MKRIFDILFSLLLIISLFIPILLIAFLVLCNSGSPVIYWSRRIGKNNKLFKMPKFRSMKLETPEVATDLLENNRSFLTTMGPFLRKTSLDELPQLWSILKGDMSFVGPRPALYNQFELIDLRISSGIHSYHPGLTGWAQINGRNNLSISEKVKLDKEYVDNQSLLFDINIGQSVI